MATTDPYALLIKKQAQLERVLGLPDSDSKQRQLSTAQNQLKQAELDYGKQVVSSNDYSTPQASAAASAFQAMQAEDKAKQERAAAAAAKPTTTYTGTYSPQAAIQPYLNENSGKLLGYIYENYLPSGAVTFGQGSDNERTMLTPDVTPDYSDEEGRQYVTYNKGYDNETRVQVMTPAQYEATATRSVKAGHNAKSIPIYEPPLKFVQDGKPLTDKQKFNLTARLAGAGDAEIPGKIGAGIIDSTYFPLEMRQALGLPKSFDMLRNIDPTKTDWGFSKAQIHNPRSHGFFGDLFTDLAVPIQIALTLAGQPQLAGTIRGATQAMNNDGNILKGAAKGFAQASAAQVLALGMEALGDAIDPNVFTTAEAAIDAGTLGGQATGIAGLLNDVSQATGISLSTLQNMAKGAATSAIKGGDPLEGAMAALASSGTTSAVSGIEGFSSLDPALQKSLLSMASGATNAAISGGDIGAAALQSGLGSLASSIGKMPREYSTPTESFIDQGGLGSGADYQQNSLADFLSDQTPTPETEGDYGKFLPEGLRAEDATSEQSAINPLLASPTESWIDQGRLVSDPFALEILGTSPEEFTPPTAEDMFETQQPTLDQLLASPTESWIDQGRLVLTPEDIATPTESWIDQGGLGQPLTPADIASSTEDYIDRGGLGGGAPTGGTTGGTTSGGGTKPGGTTGGTKAPVTPAPTTTPAPAGAANQGNLLALLGLLGNQQAPSAPQQTPLAEIKSFYDIDSGKYTSGFGTPYAEGGSVRDLMHILRG